MFARLLILFIAVPLIELALLLRIGQSMGLVPTVALVVVTGIAGAALARREGLRTLMQIRSDLSSGRFPAARLLDGAMILVAAGLLLTPGVLTDAFGLLLLLPAGRGLFRARLAGRMRRLVEDGRSNVTIYYDPPS